VENICNSSGGAEEEKGKRGSKPDENSVWHEKWCISDSPPSLERLMYLFLQVFF
jgi:hypothetical protein